MGQQKIKFTKNQHYTTIKFNHVTQQQQQQQQLSTPKSSNNRRSSNLKMIDQNVIQGVGIGMVVFTESQGERAKERGSEFAKESKFASQFAGQMMEDVEVDSVGDISSLANQLEQALRESGAAKEEELQLSEEEMERIKEETEDGW